MVSAYANSRALVVILSVLLLSWGTFVNFTPANAILNCDGFVATIIGTSGDDLIDGTPEDNVIMGLDGNDIINGNGGNDIVCSGSGSDVVTTGSGNDYLHGEGGADTFHAGDGNNTIDADFGSEGDVITTGSGDDYILLGAGFDNIDSGDGHDKIIAGGGDDIIQTKGGDDKIYGGDGDDCINSGSGTDTIDGGTGDNNINTGSCGAIPVISITSPSDGDIFGEGTLVTFSGTATDSEDGDLTPSLFWASDIDGAIGLGGTLSLSNLSVGTHTITASVTDSASNTGSYSHTIMVNPIGIPSISITNPIDGLISADGSEITFTGTATDVEDGDLTASIIWTSDLAGSLGSGDSFTTSSLSIGTHTITASVTDSTSKTNSVSIIITIGSKVIEELTTLICHFPPGNPGNWQELMIAPSALQAHKEHGDQVGPCVDDDDLEKRLEIIKIKKQREETSKKNELKEKRNELKEIQNEINQLKKNVKNDEELKDTVKELISDIKETLQTLKSDFDYDKEYKGELKTEFKKIKQKIYDDLTVPEKNSIHTVDSKISILSHSDDPKNDAKKLGLDYKNGMTTVAIQLTDDNQKVLHQLSSIGTIDAKNNNNVQITIKLNDLPKLSSIQGIENIRPPFPAVQFEESLSEGVYFMNADLAQYAGITGKGIKVAVLDLSFTNNPKISDNIVEVKSFRQGVSVLPDHWDGDEALHGTAVAEIIADVAPDVELFLYSMESDIEFAAAVDEAISKNVDIIAMSAGWPNFPTDGTSHITKKIEEAVENGIVFVVPAGNFGNKHWEGNFVDSNLNNWHDFSNTDEGLSITVTESRIAEEKPIIAHMMWDVGLDDVADLELVLVNPLGQIVDFSANKQEKSSDNPFEYIYHLPDTEGIYSLGVLYSGDMISPSNRPHATLEIFTVNDELEYPVTQSSVSVPADANGAIVVGAVNHLDGILEPYSSQGPTNNGKLAPHVVGPDGVTTLALDGKPFYGTSATTPYVAGLAALILENNPNMSPEQLLTKIQQNTEPGLFSLQNEYDYATGYGTASAVFLLDDSEVMQ